jgi:hypothetical protein
VAVEDDGWTCTGGGTVVGATVVLDDFDLVEGR